MDLLPGAEQLEIVAAAAEFLAERMPIEQIRANRDAEAPVPESAVAGVPPSWAARLSGSTRSPAASGSVLRRRGAAVPSNSGSGSRPGPFLACTLAARVAARCGDAALAERIGSGEPLSALAVLRGDGDVAAGQGHLRPVRAARAPRTLWWSRAGRRAGRHRRPSAR